MLTPEKNITYEELLEKYPPETRLELIDNEVIMSPSPNTEHQDTSRELSFLLYEFAKKHDLGKIYSAPYDVILSENRVVQPDILFISKANLSKITKKGYQGVPDLVIEIVSPSSFYHDSVTKFRLYEEAGVKEFWLVEPANKVVEVFYLKNNHYELHCFVFEKGKVTSALLEGLEIEITEIFTEI